MLDTAIILAGGLGTRLRPLTDQTPKPLLPLKGKPIVQHVIENLRDCGVNNFILSIGYQADKIQDYFGDGSKLDVKINYSVEKELLGTGGAIRQAAVGLEKPFFLAWGDNLADFDYQEMYKTFLREAPQVTMALVPREDVENFGVAKLKGERIITFVEKPKREEAPSNLINAGAFIVEPECLKMLPEGKCSIERDCFEKLAPLGEISAFVHQGQWYPTDTMEKYTLACKGFKAKIDLNGKKVIIADVDDTICESCQQISLEMAEEISRLIEKGYQFAFISGTKVVDLQKMISSRLLKEHHLLGTTGTNYTLINESGESKVIYNHSLSSQEKKEIILALEKLILQFNIQTMTTKEDQLQDRDSQITLSAIGRNAPQAAKANFDPDLSKRKGWVNYLSGILDFNKYDIKIGGTTSLDVVKKGLDKAWAIRKFAEYHHLDLNQIIFIGDKIFPGGNDFAASWLVDCIGVESPEDTLRELRKIV